MKFLPVNGEYIYDNGNYIILHGRANNRKFHLKMKAVDPYFYVEDTNGKYMSIDGKRLTRIVVNTPNDVPVVRTHYPKTWEADIPFVWRNWVDRGFTKYIETDTLTPTDADIKPRKCYIDIEVDDSRGFPDKDQANMPILSVVFYDSQLGRYIILTDKEVNAVTLTEYIGNLGYEVRTFPSEERMLKSLHSYLTNDISSPDIILGWNVNFDFHYIKNRMRYFGFTIRDEEYCVFDLMEGYKRLRENDIVSMKLDYVAKIVLNDTKVKYVGRVVDMYNNNIEKELFYNYKDVYLCKGIDEKMGIFDFFFHLSSIAGTLNIEKYNAMYIADMYLLRMLHNEGIALPTHEQLPKENRQGSPPLTPADGLFENVVVIDHKSEYPTLIYTFNLSPDTIYRGDQKININGVKFDSSRKGIIPKIVKNLMSEREKIKSQLKIKYDEGLEYKQRVLKEITNSFYGIFGSPYYRMYNPDIQGAITFLSRELTKYTKEFLTNKGKKVLYGDTDSLFFQTPFVKDDIIKLVQELNDSLPNFTKIFGVEDSYPMEFEFESFYDKWFQSGTKKRYFGHLIYHNGKMVDEIKVRGYEVRRSNTPKYTSEKLWELINIVLSDPKQIDKWVEVETKRWREKSINISDIGVLVGLSKPIEEYKDGFQAAKAVRNSQKYGITVDTSTGKIKMYFLKNDGVIAVNYDETLPKKFQSNLDWAEHKRRCFDLPFEDIIQKFQIKPDLSKGFIIKSRVTTLTS